MRIIKQGQLPEEKLYRSHCYHCKTEVEFKRGEAEFHSDCRDGDYLNIKCPVCNKIISVAINCHNYSGYDN